MGRKTDMIWTRRLWYVGWSLTLLSWACRRLARFARVRVAVKIQRSESLKAVYKALNCRIEMDSLVTKPNRKATAGRNFLAAGRMFFSRRMFDRIRNCAGVQAEFESATQEHISNLNSQPLIQILLSDPYARAPAFLSQTLIWISSFYAKMFYKLPNLGENH